MPTGLPGGRVRALSIICLVLGAGPACTFDPLPASAFLDGSAGVDAGALVDAGDPPADASDVMPTDAAPPVDAGFPDAEAPEDATAAEDAAPADVPPPPEDATVVDTGPADSGVFCGNGVIEANEGCDDGDLDPGDGCSATCTPEAGFDCRGMPTSDCRPLIAVRDTMGQEGDVIGFALDLSIPAPWPVDVTWSTIDGTATAPGDYTPVSQATLQFMTGQASTTLDVTTLNDSLSEATEQFDVQLDVVTGAYIADMRATASLEDVSVLSDNGLVARYFLNEAGTGQALPSLVQDSAVNPLALSVITTQGQPFGVTTGGNRGVAWDRNSPGGNGRLSALADNTKIQSRLNGSRTGTLEAVAAISTVVNASRLIHLGFDDAGDFSLMVGDPRFGPPEISFSIAGEVVSWPWPGGTGIAGNRTVFTLVFDSRHGAANIRAQLYINGVDQGAANRNIDQNESIPVDQGARFVVGNRTGGNRAPGGEIFYAAVYDQPLSAAEVALNSALLLNSDDP